MKKYIISTCVSALLLSPSAYGEVELSDILSGSDGITQSLGEINNIIDQINGFNLQSILQNVEQDNEILGCLVNNVDLGDIAGALPSMDGICGAYSLGSSLSGMLSSPYGRCVAGDLSDQLQSITDMQNQFSSFCNGVGDIGGWYDGSNTGNNGVSLANRNEYSPVTTMLTNVEGGSVTGGVKTSGDDKPLKDKKYPSGVTVEQLYGGEDGGKIYKSLTDNPDGEDAQAIKTNNVNALILKEMAVKLRGNTNENEIHLPENKLKVIEGENAAATFASLGKVDISAIKNKLIVAAREKYKTLDADSTEAYLRLEKETYAQMISSDPEIKKYLAGIREQAIESITQKYEMELMKIKERKDYIPNPSYTIERVTKVEYRDEFKVKAFLQMNRETIIKTKEAEEKRLVDMQINQAVQDAYYLSSIFRADIAKKEIDAILKAVDDAIQ